ncbi:MAG: lycopene cyclase domain-containing protein [Acidobacteriota bacterium]
MKEYTIASGAAVLVSLAADRLLGTKLSSTRAFWIFWAVMCALMTIVNGYLTWRPIVRYGEAFFLGIRIGTIPLEDYGFGFALITLNLVVWEYFSTTKKGL